MKKHMVNVVIASHEDIVHNPIHDVAEGIILRSFGPCSKAEGDVLADRINSWIRGGNGKGPAEAFRILGLDLNPKSGDAWASCNRTPHFGIDDLLDKFQVEEALVQDDPYYGDGD